MKRKLGKGSRLVIGIMLTIGVFAFILLVLNSWLGEEDVRFDYRAMFIYLGSEDNEPLENLALRFPAPQIENKFAGDIFGSWELYRIEDNGDLMLQANANGVINLSGARSSQLGIYTSGMENSVNGPTLTWEFDCLYSQEVFIDFGWTWVQGEKANAVTLRVYDIQEDWSHAYWHTPKAEQENKKIDFSFVVGLYRENTLIERYEVTWENEDFGWYYLSSIV